MITTGKTRHISSHARKIRRERGKQYGADVVENHRRMGAIWTALLENYYRVKLPKPLDGHMVALMFAAVKIFRASFPRYHPDNYVDARNYLDFAEEAENVRTNVSISCARKRSQKTGPAE